MPRTRTKPKPANTNHFEDDTRETKRRVEFEDHPPVPHYYEDRQPHANNNHSHNMHHLMNDIKLSDMDNSHSGAHHQEDHHEMDHRSHPHHEVSHMGHGGAHETNHHPHAASREPSHSHPVHREPSHLSHTVPREPSYHNHRQISHQPSNSSHAAHREPNNLDLPGEQPQYNAKVSRRYFVEDEFYVDRIATIEQEKYNVGNMTHQSSNDSFRQAVRYPSYASSNPYLGTLPDEHYGKKARRGTEERFVKTVE